MQVVLAVLNLLYVFSKRSNYITRLGSDKRTPLLARLQHLAEVRSSPALPVPVQTQPIALCIPQQRSPQDFPLFLPQGLLIWMLDKAQHLSLASIYPVM